MKSFPQSAKLLNLNYGHRPTSRGYKCYSEYRKCAQLKEYFNMLITGTNVPAIVQFVPVIKWFVSVIKVVFSETPNRPILKIFCPYPPPIRRKFLRREKHEYLGVKVDFVTVIKVP